MLHTPRIPAKVSRAVLLESGHRCAVCGASLPLTQANIVAWRRSSEYTVADLICLCEWCYKRTDREQWGEQDLAPYKENPRIWQWYEQTEAMPEPTAKIELTIEVNARDLNAQPRQWLQCALAAFLDISPYWVWVYGAVGGAQRKVTVELPQQNSQALLDAYSNADGKLSGHLDPMNLVAVRRKVADHIWSDHPTIDDRLGYQAYCDAIVELIGDLNPECNGLTLGIYGSWGSGKTSLMRMIRQQLKQLDRYIVVWFDAWKYSEENDLWVALLQQMLAQIGSQASRWEVFKLNLRLWINRLDWLKIRDAIILRTIPYGLRVLVILLAVAWIGLWVIGSGLNRVPTLTAYLTGSLVFTIIGVVAWNLYKAVANHISNLFDKRFDIDLEPFVKPATTTRFVAFVDEFIRDFRTIVSVVGRKHSVVIIIDDLDRCLPEQIVPVLEAIKQFVSDESAPMNIAESIQRTDRGEMLPMAEEVFILGADRKVIEKAISKRYEDFVGDEERELERFSRQYLEKIVQIPFQPPPLQYQEVEKFVQAFTLKADVQNTRVPADGHDSPSQTGPSLIGSRSTQASLNGHEPTEDLQERQALEILATGLERNPRQLKRALRVYYFLNKIARHRKISVRMDLLALLVVIQYRWREIYDQLFLFPSILDHAVRLLTEEDQAFEETLTLGWPGAEALELLRTNLNLQRLLGRLSLFQEAPLPLDGAIIARHLYLTELTAEPAVSSSFEAWNYLLSGDPVKIDRVRHDAARAPQGISGLVRGLVGKLYAGDEKEREQSLYALAEIGGRLAIDYILDFVRDSEQVDRRLYSRALYALSRFPNDSRVTGFMGKVLAEPDDLIPREIAIKCLERAENPLFFDECTQQTIGRVALYGEESVSHVASKLVIRHKLYGLLTKQLQGDADGTWDRQGVLDRLFDILVRGGIEGHEVVSHLRSLALNAEGAAQSRAVDTLGKIGTSDAVAALSELWNLVATRDIHSYILEAILEIAGSGGENSQLALRELSKLWSTVPRDLQLEIASDLVEDPTPETMYFLVRYGLDPQGTSLYHIVLAGLGALEPEAWQELVLETALEGETPSEATEHLLELFAEMEIDWAIKHDVFEKVARKSPQPGVREKATQWMNREDEE